MYSVQGQESWNVFANDWSNHIPPVSGAQFVALGAKFATGMGVFTHRGGGVFHGEKVRKTINSQENIILDTNLDPPPDCFLSAPLFSGTPNIQQVGLSDFAMIGENGVNVPTGEVNYPYKLVFR